MNIVYRIIYLYGTVIASQGIVQKQINTNTSLVLSFARSIDSSVMYRALCYSMLILFITISMTFDLSGTRHRWYRYVHRAQIFLLIFVEVDGLTAVPKNPYGFVVLLVAHSVYILIIYIHIHATGYHGYSKKNRACSYSLLRDII